MFVALDSSNEESSVIMFTWVGTPPIASIGPGLRLRIVRSPNGVQILWPVSAEGYVLQCSPKLSPPEWRVVDIQPSIIGGKYSVTLPAQSTAFYRLCRQ